MTTTEDAVPVLSEKKMREKEEEELKEKVLPEGCWRFLTAFYR